MPAQVIASIIGALPLPAVFVQMDSRIAAVNGRAEEILGEGLTGRHYITALRQPAVLDAIETCLRTGAETDARYLSNDGAQDTNFDLHCAFVTNETIPGALVTLTDVTEAEQMPQMRRDFVANVSHELRTPLTAVMGFVETLQGPARDDAAAREKFLEIIARETARMNRLVGDLLSLSRVEGAARQRPTEDVQLAELLASVVHTLGPMADDAGAALRLEVQSPEAEVTADPDQLRQVFSNLIENALKYGGAGVEVTVTLGLVQPDPRLRQTGVRVRVADTGPGFDPVHIPRLTERFYRIDSHRSREMGGTGLGLAIVKHIINRHRGRLEITSEPDQGSEFTVVLPV
jgi:two-component system phosphate regulon sensor histidine kinase PhoR